MSTLSSLSPPYSWTTAIDSGIASSNMASSNMVSSGDILSADLMTWCPHTAASGSPLTGLIPDWDNTLSSSSSTIRRIPSESGDTFNDPMTLLGANEQQISMAGSAASLLYEAFRLETEHDTLKEEYTSKLALSSTETEHDNLRKEYDSKLALNSEAQTENASSLVKAWRTQRASTMKNTLPVVFKGARNESDILGIFSDVASVDEDSVDGLLDWFAEQDTETADAVGPEFRKMVDKASNITPSLSIQTPAKQISDGNQQISRHRRSDKLAVET
ncbi:hypothetical protein BD324DRAFT_650693 [Kockovaella imperatae]|uniref:Uncharacterized protein n=1 Tax=Kockovaella imperatae TaxID=4999 RepID=A0A1Y1UGC4_9TREE|nr:hypothetical protein BD324DRAFT_650693 [Kockovaella imperatae]ORX37078.1 hypothetical protein BD324DRAFT_650693 [Kockovaella imperatae]